MGVGQLGSQNALRVTFAASLEGLEARVLLFPRLDLDGGRGRRGPGGRVDVGLERRRGRVPGFPHTHSQHGERRRVRRERGEERESSCYSLLVKSLLQSTYYTRRKSLFGHTGSQRLADQRKWTAGGQRDESFSLARAAEGEPSAGQNQAIHCFLSLILRINSIRTS